MLFAEVNELAVEPIAHRAPLVFFDERGGINAEGQVVTAQLPQFINDGLKNSGDTDSFIHARADITNAKFERRIFRIGARIPPNLRGIGDTVRADERCHKAIKFGARGEGVRRNACAWEVAKDGAAIRLQARLASHPKRRARRETQDVWQQVTHNIHGVNHELGIFDADVYMCAEDEQALRELAHVLAHAEIALEGCDVLLHPRREGVRACGGDLQAVLRRQLHQPTTQTRQLTTRFGRRVAHLRADFDNRLMQLGFHLLSQHNLTCFEQLCDIRFQFARVWVNDLIFFFDTDAERWAGGGHRASSVGSNW